MVDLNRVVAISFTDGPDAALRLVDELAGNPALTGYPYLASTRADLLQRLGRDRDAAAAYREAVLLTSNATEAAFLRERAEQFEKGPDDRSDPPDRADDPV